MAGDIPTSPEWDASPSLVSPAFCQVLPTIFQVPFLLLGEERHCEI